MKRFIVRSRTTRFGTRDVAKALASGPSRLGADLGAIGADASARVITLKVPDPFTATHARELAARFAENGLEIEADRQLVPVPFEPLGSAAPARGVPRRAGPPLLSGKGVTLAIIDQTGVKGHEVFGSRLTCYDVLDDEVKLMEPSIVPAQGHGTAVASVAAGSGRCAGPASDARIIVYRATMTSQVSLALRHIEATHPEVKVICMAQEVMDDAENQALGGHDMLHEDIARLAKERVMVCAAGNHGSALDTIRIPAAYAEVVTVGAYDECDLVDGPSSRDRVFDISSRGKGGSEKPTFLMPGNSYEVACSDPNRTNDYESVVGGTSLAAAYAAGVIATWFEAAPALGTTDVIGVIARSCRKLRDGSGEYPPHVQGHGALLVDRAAATFTSTSAPVSASGQQQRALPDSAALRPPR